MVVQAGAAGGFATGDQAGRAWRMTAREPTDIRVNPGLRCLAGAAIGALGIIAVIELIGQLIGWPRDGLETPIAAAAVAGLVVGAAVALGIPRLAKGPLTSRDGTS